MMQVAAIYARVSSDKQKEENTIASQTAALIAFAREQGYSVPDEWVFEDEGYSGATLVRPGLERVRDLAAEGQIQAILVHAPDRLSRKYAYQVLLTEEFARAGVEVLFVKAPRNATAEDQLLLQFQGMIAEYERAQILERSRRGKRHRAREGQVSVLSGAPFGYRYVRKTDQMAAYYAVIEAEAQIVRSVFERYTAQGLSIWAMLRNPAYKGTACFGKTQKAPRQRITRPLRLRGGFATRDSGQHERPRADWIEIPVPAIVSETTFALAEERLQANKKHAPRRTIAPSILQGIVSCSKCGYALYRASTHSSARKIYYYRCLGSDRYRHLGGPVCDNHPIRQDLLDTIVWNEIVKLIEDPSLIKTELDRRLKVACNADPTKRRIDMLQRDIVRTQKSIDRLLTAYQEELISLDELRRRNPPLRQREKAARSELQSIADQTTDRAAYLRLAETLAAFLSRLRASLPTLDVLDRQKIVRLLVKEVLVGDDQIVIRHSISLANRSPEGGPSPHSGQPNGQNSRSYLLRSGSTHRALSCPLVANRHDPVFQDACLQPFLDQADDALIADPMLHEADEPVFAHLIEERPDVGVQYEVHLPAFDPDTERVKRIVRAAPRPEPVTEPEEVFLVDRIQQCGRRPLDDLVLQSSNR
jgi:site-specific DNA recombinase